MGRRSDYKKIDRIADYDLNAGIRSIIDTSRPCKRRVRDVLRHYVTEIVAESVEFLSPRNEGGIN